MMNDEMPNAPSLRQVEADERKAEELEEKVVELKVREEALGRRIAEAHADGADEDKLARLTAERREAKELRQDIQSALPVLAKRVAARREAACHNEAENRLIAVARAHGSFRASYGGDVARIQKCVEAVEAAVEKFNSRYAGIQKLEAEVVVLRDRFPDLPSPAIERVVQPARHDRAKDALKRARDAALADPPPVRPVLVRDYQPATAKRLVDSIAETPTGEILEAAGGWDEEAFKRRREAHEAEHRETEQTARADHRERVTATVRRILSDGPVPIEEVRRQVEAAGIDPDHPFGDTATLAEFVTSRDFGLGGFVVRRPGEPDAGPHWTLRKAEGFVLAGSDKYTGALR